MGKSLATEYGRTFARGGGGQKARNRINKRYQKRYGRNITDDFDFV